MHQRQHGGVGVAFIIPNLNIMSNEKIRNKLSVIIGEMVAILLALEGVERKKPNKVSSDSSSALTSLKNMQSETRQDILVEIEQTVYRITKAGVNVNFTWIPDHIVGVDGNEMADKYAKVEQKQK